MSRPLTSTMNARLSPRAILSFLCLGLAIAAAAVAASPSVKEIDLPAGSLLFKPSDLPGYTSATTHCLTCHSVEYTATQPLSPRAYWKATVVKMQKTFGAPIPDEEIEVIADYLVKTYGNEQSASAAAAPAGSVKPRS